MKRSSEFWTIVIAALTTLMIWGWAAGEDRDRQQMAFKLTIDVPQGERLVARSTVESITVELEGTRGSLNAVGRATGNEVLLTLGEHTLPLDPGEFERDLLSMLQQHPSFTDLGLNVVECAPASAQITVDTLVDIPAQIRHEAPGVRFEEITFEPSVVTVSMPGTLAEGFARGIAVIAPLPSAQLQQLDPDLHHEMIATLQPPRALDGNPDVRIDPPTVRTRFKMRSQLRDTVVDSVVVHLAGPEEDGDDYSVQLEPDRLTDVRIRAEADVIRRIEEGLLRVVALVHMNSRDKELGVESLPPTIFLALPTTSDDPRRGTAVQAIFDETPEISISVDVRIDPPPSS